MQLRQLTFLRFVAAAGVVVFHYGTQAPSLAWGLPYWKIANAAVSFFFFFSGFILGHVYGRRPIARRADFYVARAARILPLYALALLAAAIFHTRRGSLDWDALALNALLLQAWVPGYSQTINAPGWSLSVEMFFYLSFPLLLPVVARARSSARLLPDSIATMRSRTSAASTCCPNGVKVIAMSRSTRPIASATPRASRAGGPLAARTLRVMDGSTSGCCATGTYTVGGVASRSER
jgi:peptidoglycan/LPS O-acetylase OafA/YrhL